MIKALVKTTSPKRYWEYDSHTKKLAQELTKEEFMNYLKKYPDYEMIQENGYTVYKFSESQTSISFTEE